MCLEVKGKGTKRKRQMLKHTFSPPTACNLQLNGLGTLCPWLVGFFAYCHTVFLKDKRIDYNICGYLQVYSNNLACA